MADLESTSKWRDKYKTPAEYYKKAFNSKYYTFDKYELEIAPDETDEEIAAYDTKKQQEETYKCAMSFFYWCHKYCRILHPMHGLMPFILYKYQRDTIQAYEEHRFNIIRKFRQGGLTTVTLLWSLWKCLFQLDQQIMVVSKTDREAVDIGVIIDRSYDQLPKWMAPPKYDGKWNDHVKTFPDTGGRIMFHTPEAARGKALTYLVVDEAAFIDDMEKHWKALYPILSTGGSCIVISTVNGLGNWYQETYYGAREGINKFHVIDLKYQWHPEYNNPQWVEDQKAQLGEDGWKQEVIGDFLGSGSTFIPPQIIKKLDERVKDIIPIRKLFSEYINKDSKEEAATKMKLKEWRRAKGISEDEEEEKGALWIFKEPLDGHEYIIASDCAEGVGSGGDNSAFQVIDVSSVEQVAEFYSNTVPPHIFAEILSIVGAAYNTALIVVENMSPGGSVIGLLQHNLFYENLYYDNQNNKSRTQVKCGIKTGPLNRPLILETIKRRLMNGTLTINSTRLVKEIGTFVFNKNTKRAEAEKHKHDDAIMAMCLALYVRDANMRDIPLGSVTQEMAKDISKSLTSVDFESIKKEILRGAPEDWLNVDNKDDMPSILDNEEIPSGVIYHIKRPADALLKEFGW